MSYYRRSYGGQRGYRSRYRNSTPGQQFMQIMPGTFTTSADATYTQYELLVAAELRMGQILKIHRIEFEIPDALAASDTNYAKFHVSPRSQTAILTTSDQDAIIVDGVYAYRGAAGAVLSKSECVKEFKPPLFCGFSKLYVGAKIKIGNTCPVRFRVYYTTGFASQYTLSREFSKFMAP